MYSLNKIQVLRMAAVLTERPPAVTREAAWHRAQIIDIPAVITNYYSDLKLPQRLFRYEIYILQTFGLNHTIFQH